MVAALEAAFLVGDKENVGVVNLGEANEVVHLAVGNGEWRVLAVGSHGEVVVIIAQAGVARVVDNQVKSCRCGTDKEDVGYQRFGDCLSLAVNHSDLIVHWQEDLEAFAFEPFAGFEFAIVGHAKDMPRGRFVEDIPYRHPSRGLAGEGAQCRLSTWGRVVALPVVHINQRVH